MTAVSSLRRLAGEFRWSLAVTALAIVAAALYGGLRAAGVVALLIGLEASISFDNAVVNATVLRRMSERWQRAFLTVGLLVAVVLMRLVFPIVIVAVATGLGVAAVAEQALTDKQAYAAKVEAAKPIIGAFGGAFLLMVALRFLLDRDRDEHWLGPLERRLASLGAVPGLASAITVVAIVLTSQLLAPDAALDVLVAGLAGLVAHVLVHGVAAAFEQRLPADEAATGAAGLGAFLYLEMLDASFSLDGVLGAFAITQDVVLVALGLGVGAVYVRSLTVRLVRRRTLRRQRYLQHGAHWAIGALAIVLLVSTRHHVPEWITGLVGLGLVGAAFVSSRRNPRSSEAAAA